MIIFSKGFNEIAFDRIISCTYSRKWGSIQFKLIDGTEVKSHISLIRSQSQVVKVVEEINRRIPAPDLRVHSDAR